MVFNKTIALLTIIILSPVFFITAVGILISDFGPIIYTAHRAGKNGKMFELYKFRSMSVNKGDSSKITSKDDVRVFAFGKIIRLLKIDELPQLFNILKGDMNLIGPRPEDISIVNEHYNNLMFESLNVNPGLSSPGSLYYYTHVEDNLVGEGIEEYYIKKIMPLKVKIDVVYVRNKSFFYDLSLIFKTIKIIIQRGLGKKSFTLPKEYILAQKL